MNIRTLGIIVIVLTSFIYHQAKANDTWAEMHVTSKHFPGTYKTAEGPKEFNDQNFGLGIMRQLNSYVEYGAGFYDNSYHKTSLYTGVDIHTTDYAPVRLGVSMGLVSGYTSAQVPNGVMLLPNLTITPVSNIRVKIGVLPGAIKLVTLTVGVKF